MDRHTSLPSNRPGVGQDHMERESKRFDQQVLAIDDRLDSQIHHHDHRDHLPGKLVGAGFDSEPGQCCGDSSR